MEEKLEDNYAQIESLEQRIIALGEEKSNLQKSAQNTDVITDIRQQLIDSKVRNY